MLGWKINRVLIIIIIIIIIILFSSFFLFFSFFSFFFLFSIEQTITFKLCFISQFKCNGLHDSFENTMKYY